MAFGKVQADTFETSTGGTFDLPAINNGRAKAWGAITFGSGTPFLQQSFNVASVTDISVGATDFNLSNAFQSSLYSGSTSNNSSASNGVFLGNTDTNSVRTSVANSVDNNNSFNAHGTLA